MRTYNIRKGVIDMSTHTATAEKLTVEAQKKVLKVALCGNPNAGKTCIFNALTGSRQKVGNWSGVTVEKKVGKVMFGDYEMEVVDLPGTYSLTAFSIEEIIARDFIIKEKPDVVINIVDSTNFERNLYLTTQLVELGARVVLALNMSDEAEHKGIHIDKKHLGQLLGMPVVSTVGNRGQGVKDLLREVVAVSEQKEPLSRHIHIDYGAEVEEELKKIQTEIRKDPELTKIYSTRWLSVKLLEHDKQMEEMEHDSPNEDTIISQVKKSHNHLEETLNDESEVILADRRYGFIKGVIHEVYNHRTTDRLTISDKIDKVFTNRLLGIPILLGLLWVMFQTTFTLGAYPMDWIDGLVGLTANLFSTILPDGLVKELVVDGMIAGVGGVLVFLPNILILFFFISLFEDTGYMARAAFIMDRIMHTIGLHGKSFIPMIMGFGCNAPAIMATRTLENKTDRTITILINPLISCSARLPVYILLASAFFPQNAGNVIFGIYITGIVLAILVGQLFRKTLFKGTAAPFVMELPPYRVPLLKSVLIHMWEKGSIFLRKVGGIILAASIVIWFLTAFPKDVQFSKNYNAEMTAVETQYETIFTNVANEEERAGLKDEMETKIAEIETLKENERLAKSYAGRMGKFTEPVIKPLGFDWKAGIALITGIAAKEIVVSTFGVLYQTGQEEDAGSESLRESLRNNMTPLSALAFMLFTLIYIPCMGTLGIMYRELGSLKWTAFAVGYTIVLAWIVAFIVYQGGTLLGIGG
jgi:ferrous iron transport protein B